MIVINSKGSKTHLSTAESAAESMNLSFLSYLECSGCGEKYKHAEINTFCPICQSPLLSRYDLESVRQHVDRDAITSRKKGMWRWHELLPVLHKENQIFLGEGDTPLLSLPHLEKELLVCGPIFLCQKTHHLPISKRVGWPVQTSPLWMA
jgi:threonine synthase